MQLDERQEAALRKELRRNASSLAEIMKIRDKARGRYPITYTRDFIGTLLPFTQDTRTFANLLANDALLRAHDKDLDRALVDCRCLIHAQRAVGDEPTLVSMLVRMAIRQTAVKQLERILAQGEPGEASLTSLQHLLEEEAEEPLFLIAARGQRGGTDALLEALQTGAIKTPWPYIQALAAPGERPSVLQGVRFKLAPGSLKADRAALLHYNNQAVAVARLPVEKQRQRLEELQLDPKALPHVARVLAADWPKLLDQFHRDQANVRCGILLLAVERYRRANHCWPQRLDDLVPAYLTKVPLFPFDGKPLRLERSDCGVMLWAASQDCQYNLFFSLWDVSKRRQPPRLHKPAR